MRKTLLLLMTMFLTMNCHSAYILWVGIDEYAQIHDGDPSNTTRTQSIANWISSLNAAPVDVGGRIRIGNTILLAGWEDPSIPIPAGQTTPVVVFDDDISEFGLLVVDDNDEPTGAYADWQSIKLPDDDPNKHIAIYYEIGFWDENNNWEFVTVATATGWLDKVYDLHGYESGSLAPPTETPWHPRDFYTYDSPDVPEPSVILLALVGTILLFKRRDA